MDSAHAQILSTGQVIQKQHEQLEALAIPVVIDVGQTSVRLDEQDATDGPHSESQVVVATADALPADWNPPVVSPVLAWPDVSQNDSSMQQAALELANTRMDTRGQVENKLQPAWEVDNFRWPKIAQVFLAQHRELFQEIGSTILNLMTKTQRRLGICSGNRQEGKTILSICLAEWAAEQGKSVLLLDADNEHPKLSYMSGVNPEFGWRSILEGELPITETLIRSAKTGLTLLPLVWDKSPPGRDRFKVLDRLSSLVSQLKYEFDMVILDLGTVEHLCTQITPGMDLVDHMLIVRDAFQTSNGQLMESKAILENLGFRHLSVAENFCRKAAG